MPPTTAAGERALSSEPLGRDHVDRAVGAGVGGDVGIGQDADGEVAGRAGDRERAVEVALVLAGRAAEVERQRVAVDGRPQRDRQVALARLEHVVRLVDAVVELPQAGARAALGVVEHRREGLAQHLGAEPVVQLRRAQRADPARGELGAQVGAALLRPAHLRNQLVDRAASRTRGSITTPSSASVSAVGRHRPGVGPPTSAWWARAAANAISRSASDTPANTGVITVMSGRWVPPL